MLNLMPGPDRGSLAHNGPLTELRANYRDRWNLINQQHGTRIAGAGWMEGAHADHQGKA